MRCSRPSSSVRETSSLVQGWIGPRRARDLAPSTSLGLVRNSYGPLFQTSNFYLAVSARTPLEELRARFGSHVKIGSVLKMRQIVTSSLAAGVGVSPTPTPPAQLRVLPGYVYFELDRSAPDWRDFSTAPALGLHVAGEWPELKLELWWVKRSSR